MKLKSLLLGSAAALALSTGAQAADPIVDFVALDVCDAYGISGLTISSDDTCLRISGYVDYEFEVGENELTDGFYANSDVEWRVIFDATTQTDAGAARAVIRLREDTETNATRNDQLARVDEAYVQFGDTTVLSAGRKGTLFNTRIVPNGTYGWMEFDGFDRRALLDRSGADVARGAGTAFAQYEHDVIQIESVVAEGFTVLAALESLNTADAGGGSAGLGVRYSNAGISGEAGVLLGNLFGEADLVNYYATVQASFDAFAVRGGFIGNDRDDWIASIGASATLDMFTLDADAAFAEGDQYFVGVEGSFAATDIIDVYVGAAYADGLLTRARVGSAYYGGQGDSWDEVGVVYGGVNVAATENISVNAEVGYVEYTRTTATGFNDLVYGAAGVSYAPGGGFTSGLDVYADTEDAYAVTFNARKSF